MTADFFTWCPFIAFLIGALSTLAFFRSRGWGIAAFCFALFAQVFAWTFFFLALDVQQHGWTHAWNTALWGGFLVAWIGVTPYMVLGGVVGGLLVIVVRWSLRQEVRESRDAAFGHSHHKPARKIG